MRKIALSLLVFVLTLSAKAQKHIVQVALLSYDGVQYSPTNLNSFNKLSSIHYQYKFMKHLYATTGVYYVNKYYKNYCVNCSGSSDGRIRTRELETSLGIKYTPLKDRFILTPFIEAGINYADYRAENRYIYTHWGSTNFYNEVDANGFGYYGRLGTEVKISSKLFVGINAFLSVNKVREQIYTVDYINNETTDIDQKATLFNSGLELRLGYRF